MPAPIQAAFDFASAASLLAFKPACALADELGVAIDWLPFPMRRAMPAPDSAGAQESAANRHLRVRAEYVARDAARYARAQGIEIARAADGVDSTLACAGCLWANRRGVGRAYVERVLFPFWADEFDLEDEAAIAGALAGVGADGFDAKRELAALPERKAALEERGVFNVPAFLVADQLFIGRQHLPMIRWLLTGREGPGPL